MKNNIYDIIYQNGLNIKCDEDIGKHTSVKVSGKARCFVSPKSKQQLLQLLNILKNNEIKYYILGNGTNTLVANNFFDGVVISTKYLKRYKISKNIIYAQCGLGLFELADILKKNSLGGLEFAYGIPGSVGGAIFMNAGAYGGFVGDFVEYIEVIKNGKIVKIKKDKLDFAYRQSLLQKENLVVVGAKFNLHFAEPRDIEFLQNYYFQKRLKFQPYDMPSFGSCFKKNPNFPPVSKLIDDLGLKGYTIGGAQVSKKHAGFIVNIGGASCQNYLEMIKYIQGQIFEHYGFVPELEVRLLK